MRPLTAAVCAMFAATAVYAQPVNPFSGPFSFSPQTAPAAPVSAPNALPAPPAAMALPSAPAAAPPPASVVASGVSLRFDNADVYDVIQVVLGEVLKLDYTVEPSVQGKVTLRSTADIKPSELLGVLETALASTGLAIVKTGHVYKVLKDTSIAREGLPSKSDSGVSFVLRVIPLRFAQAAQVAATLKPFASPNAAIVPDPTNKYLIVADRSAVVARLEGLVDTLDNEFLQNIHVRLLKPVNADAIEIAKELDAVFKTSGLLNLPNTDATKAFFMPVPRLGAVLVASASEPVVKASEKWFAMLDAAPAKDADNFVHVYAVANSNATHLAGILQQIFTGAVTPAASAAGANAARPGAAVMGNTANAPGSTPGAAPNNTTASFGLNTAASGSVTRGNVPGQVNAISGQAGLAGAVTIIPDEVTNTLVVRASAEDFVRVRKVLEKIDTLPKQVLIQVVVAEVTLNDTLQYGVEWWLNSMASHNGKTWAAKAGLEGLIKSPSTTGVVAGTGSGFNYAILNGSSQVIGLLNLLGQDTNVNLLSAPHVLTTDGKVARVEIGNDEPVVTQTVQTPATVTSNLTTSNSVQYRPTGIILEVKPSISSKGFVSLNVAQEVSSRAGSVAVGGSEYPNFSKRRVSTDVTVEDGKPILIAGLIEDKGDNVSVGLPGVKDIPLFGALFGTTKKVKNKTELLITITPHIVTSTEDADQLMKGFSQSLGQLKTVVEAARKNLQIETRR